MHESTNRRPLKSRGMAWVAAFARMLLRTPVTPNTVSLAGIGFAAAGAGCLLLAAEHPFAWLAAALFIQLRLLANLMDGLLAVEGGRGSPTGPLFNEVPDRIEDSVLLVAAGYAAALPAAGWAAALLAMATAYVRAQGGAIGLPQDFSGPMAKQHRMAVLAAAAVLSAALPAAPIMPLALGLIAAGALLTCGLRLRRQARLLREAA